MRPTLAGKRHHPQITAMSETPYYVALGDSMSIDLYPVLDLQERGRLGPDETREVGASSLLHRNDDHVWPEFAGDDLAQRIRGLRLRNACADGGTIGDVLGRQIPALPDDVRGAARVVTVTAGGNDLLGSLFERGFEALPRATANGIERYDRMVDAVRRSFPTAVVVLTTVYDPTDGTGDLPGLSGVLGLLPLEHLDRFNDAVRRAVKRHADVVLADVHAHFLGHGVSASPADGWYWHPNPIEPGGRGASEIRRVWLEALATGL